MSTLKKDLVIALSIVCIAVLLLSAFGFADLHKEIAGLKETNAALNEEIANLKEMSEDHGNADSLIWNHLRELYFRKPLQEQSNYDLLVRATTGETCKLHTLKGENDVAYWKAGFVSEEYNKAREEEYLSAFKAALSADEGLQRSALNYLNHVCANYDDFDLPYPPNALADLKKADEASKALALEHFTNRLGLSMSGTIYYYPIDGDVRPLETWFTLRFISSGDFDWFDDHLESGTKFIDLENNGQKYDGSWYEYKSAGLCCIYY